MLPKWIAVASAQLSLRSFQNTHETLSIFSSSTRSKIHGQSNSALKHQAQKSTGMKQPVSSTNVFPVLAAPKFIATPRCLQMHCGSNNISSSEIASKRPWVAIKIQHQHPLQNAIAKGNNRPKKARIRSSRFLSKLFPEWAAPKCVATTFPNRTR